MSTITAMKSRKPSGDPCWIPSSLYRLTLEQYEAIVHLQGHGGRCQALELEAADDCNVEQLIGLQRTLGRLKTEALHRFTEGRLEGEALLSSFLAQVNDARSYLTRLILHHRGSRGPATADRAEGAGES